MQTTTIAFKKFSLDSDEEEVILKDEEISKAKNEVWKQNEFELIETETRNILFLGKTRSGKSTAVCVMKDPCYSPNNFSLFSETVEAKFQSFAIKDNTTDTTANVVKKYTFHIIDTPGLFEVKSIGDDMEARTNDSILNTISKCVENEITKINCVVMFASFDAGVDKNDVEAIKIFSNLFGKKSSGDSSSRDGLRMALCVTRSDRHDIHWRKNISEQLLLHAELAPLIKNNSMEILFMGCCDPKGGAYYNLDHLYAGYKGVYASRKKLLDFIIKSPNTIKLLDLDIMKKKTELITNTIEIAIEGFKFFKGVNDWGVQNVQQRIIIHKENMKILSENGASFQNVSEMTTYFVNLMNAAKEFYATTTIPLERRTELIWPLNIGDK